MQQLRGRFLEAGHDLRFVGGFVRDAMQGIQHKDVDFATDATPDEQEAIYRKHNISHAPTGLKHGTWTVVLDPDSVYEITSLRTETGHDGRHADVAWTRDWIEDLFRRDLTINAMALTFDGELIDPFGGEDDLAHCRVRFVGNASERIREDYLRILRFFRFHARIAGDRPLDPEAAIAVIENTPGLNGISRERVWNEMSRIISGPCGPTTLSKIIDMGIAPYIDLPVVYGGGYAAAFRNTNDPPTLMAAYLGSVAAVRQIAQTWRWSNAERRKAMFIASQPLLLLHEAKYKIAVDGCSVEWVADTLRAQSNPKTAAIIEAWPVPVFPIMGRDLIDNGMVEGPEIGLTLRKLKVLWGKNNYAIDKVAILANLREEAS